MTLNNTRSADTAAFIRSLRDLCSMTQEEFAHKLGVSLVTINRWENNRAKPTPLALRQIKVLLIELSRSEIGINQVTARSLLEQYFLEKL